MWAWIRTPRGSTTTALVVAVVLALLWFDPWSLPLRNRFALQTDPVPAPQAMTGNPPVALLEPASPSASQPGTGSSSVAALDGKDGPHPAPASPDTVTVTPPGPSNTRPGPSSALPASRPASQPDPQVSPGIGSAAAPASLAAAPAGVAAAPAGSAAAPAGPAVALSGSAVGPSGSVAASSGSEGRRSGSVVAPSGSAVSPSGSAAAVSGSTAASPGSAVASAADDRATVPGFDIVRVEPDGSTVIAGRGEPGSEVVLLDGDRAVARAQVDATGQFALLPPALEAGDHTLALQTKRSDRTPARSTQSVAVSVSRQANTRPLVALLSPDKPAEILSDGGTREAAAGASASASPPPLPLAIQSVEARQAGQFMTSGVAKPGTNNRVYLNGSFVAEVTAGPNGRWSVEVKNGMTPGRYHVRADQVDAASGKVVSRVEVPFDYPDGAASEGSSNRLVKAGSTTRRDAGAPADAVVGGMPEGPAARALAMQAVGRSPAKTPPATSPNPSAPQADANEAIARNSRAVDPQTRVDPALPAAGQAKVATEAVSDRPQGSASAVVPNLTTAIVSKGQSLWRISRKLLGRGVRYTEIYASNAAQIRDPALIYPGQVFVVATQRVN